MPEIENTVNEFYQTYLSIEPTVVAYLGSEIPDIVGDIEDSRYRVTVEIEPYVGPHVSVGRDSMTFDVSADGTVTIKNYKHLKNFDLPENLQSLVKKPLP